jgi:hypothetical protein
MARISVVEPKNAHSISNILVIRLLDIQYRLQYLPLSLGELGIGLGAGRLFEFFECSSAMLRVVRFLTSDADL